MTKWPKTTSLYQRGVSMGNVDFSIADVASFVAAVNAQTHGAHSARIHGNHKRPRDDDCKQAALSDGDDGPRDHENNDEDLPNANDVESDVQAEHGPPQAWCTALPHDAVPGPLVEDLLNEWLPIDAVSRTRARSLQYCDAASFLILDGWVLRSKKMRDEAARFKRIRSVGYFSSVQPSRGHADILGLLQHWPDVTRLDFFARSCLSDDLVVKLTAARKLRKLMIYDTSQITDAALEPLVQCRLLAELDIRSTGVQNLTAIPAFGQLEVLNCDNCSLSRAAFDNIAMIPQLTKFTFGRSVVVDSWYAGKALAKSKSLKVLRVTPNTNRPNDLFEHAHEWQAIDTLLVPQLLLKDKSVAQIALIPRLQILDIHGAPISDDALAALGEHAARLKVIDLYRCTRVTDAGIQAMCEKCGSLREVVISGFCQLRESDSYSSGRPGLQVTKIASQNSHPDVEHRRDWA